MRLRGGRREEGRKHGGGDLGGSRRIGEETKAGKCHRKRKQKNRGRRYGRRKEVREHGKVLREGAREQGKRYGRRKEENKALRVGEPFRRPLRRPEWVGVPSASILVLRSSSSAKYWSFASWVFSENNAWK